LRIGFSPVKAVRAVTSASTFYLSGGRGVSNFWLIIIRCVVDYTAMIRRHITEHLLQALLDTPAVLVNGARQSGKSTLVQSAELTKHGRQYLTFDDPGVLGAAKRDPNGFIAGLNTLVSPLP
jgi:hypothetical protein